MEAGREFGLPDCIERAWAAAEFVCGQQLLSGAWLYGLSDERSPRSTEVVDLTHTCYALEGLLQIYAGRDTLPDTLVGAVQLAIHRGLEFVNRDLCDHGALREKVWVLSGEKWKAMRERASATRAWRSRRDADGTYTVFHPEEPRLWSLGALLALHAAAVRSNFRGVQRVDDVLSRVEDLATGDVFFFYVMEY